MADDDDFNFQTPTPEQLDALSKAEHHVMTFPVCLALRALGLGHMEDHLHSVIAFKMPAGQFAFAFGWCKAAHIDVENLNAVEKAGLKAVVRALLEMHNVEVVERDGRLYAIANGETYAVGYPGNDVAPTPDIEAEVDRFRLELERELGPTSHKDLPPDDPMKRWMP